MAEEIPRTIYQPLHPDVRPRLDPEYITFHEQYLQYIPSSESTPWDPACRTAASPSAFGSSEKVPIDSIRDYPYRKYATPESIAEHREVDDQEKIRIFTPQRLPPSSGWPVLVWFHGGGWTMGGLNSENSFLTRICRDVQCVVASVNYRHAPEDPYPAAIDDCLEGYKWIVSEQGLKALRIDATRVAVGGLSAGGGLAAILSLKAAHLNIPVPTFQLLLLPVIDNTATASTIWASNAHAPWLTPARMTWYRRMYLPNEEDWKKWDVSPNFASKELLEKSPKTFIGVAECDILCEEGKAYGKSLSEVGVLVDVKEYKGSTHSLLILDGVLARGRQLVIDATEALVQHFHKS